MDMQKYTIETIKCKNKAYRRRTNTCDKVKDELLPRRGDEIAFTVNQFWWMQGQRGSKNSFREGVVLLLDQLLKELFYNAERYFKGLKDERNLKWSRFIFNFNIFRKLYSC